jgi:drug/metabolite transporter (DMT)-like permease
MTPRPSLILRRFRDGSKVRRGMAFMMVSTVTVAGVNAAVRHLGSDIHPFEMVFFRCFFGLAFFAPWLVRQGLAPLRTRRIVLHGVRGGLHVAAMLALFTALTMAPLAKVTALQFSAPLFATLLALVVLRESIRARRIVALVFGFTGTLVILRPGFAEVDLGSTLVLIAAAMMGLMIILIKILSRTDSSVTITIYSTLFSTPLALIAALPVWRTPSAEHWPWLIAIGVLASLSHLAIAQAFKEADVTAVLPLDFTRLIWIAIIGYAAFGEIPDVWTWIGGAIIFSAATYIAFREIRTKPPQRTEAVTPPA